MTSGGIRRAVGYAIDGVCCQREQGSGRTRWRAYCVVREGAATVCVTNCAAPSMLPTVLSSLAALAHSFAEAAPLAVDPGADGVAGAPIMFGSPSAEASFFTAFTQSLVLILGCEVRTCAAQSRAKRHYFPRRPGTRFLCALFFVSTPVH
jgi:hypothetical protein